MSDFDTGSAPAEAASTSAPSSSQDQVVETPNPVSTEPRKEPEKPAAEEKPKLSARDAIQQAKAKIEAKEKEETGDKAKPVASAPKEADKTKAAEPGKPEAKTEAKPADKATEKAAEPAKGSERDETGRFKAKEGVESGSEASKAADISQQATTTHEPPKRFRDEAKKDWANAPETVRSEIHRTITELEKGYEKHKASAERYEAVRQYDETARANGRDLSQSLAEVVKFETAMKTDPIGALNHALAIAGPKLKDGRPLTVNDIVTHLAGQSADERVQAAQKREQELLGHISKLEAHINGERLKAEVPKMVDEFAKEHPRFDELSDAIAVLIETGTAKDLPTAYKIAETFKPATTSGAHTAETTGAQTAAGVTGAHTTEDATLKAQEAAAAKAATSVKGAPGAGSTPARKPQSNSVRESLKRALQQAG